MTPKTFTVWGWARTLIFGSVFVFITIGWLVFMIRAKPYYSFPARLPSVLVPIATGYIIGLLYESREKFARRIRWVTRDGISVIPDAAMDWLSPQRGVLDQKLAEVIAWWVMYYSAHGKEDARGKIVDYINGTVLMVAKQETPLILYQTHGMEVRGVAWPGQISVLLQPSDMPAGIKFWATVGHEYGHACLQAMGEPVLSHHALMIAAGFPYA